jgi:hypothetical protein
MLHALHEYTFRMSIVISFCKHPAIVSAHVRQQSGYCTFSGFVVEMGTAPSDRNRLISYDISNGFRSCGDKGRSL